MTSIADAGLRCDQKQECSEAAYPSCQQAFGESDEREHERNEHGQYETNASGARSARLISRFGLSAAYSNSTP